MRLWKSALNSLAPASERSTHSSPRTARGWRRRGRSRRCGRGKAVEGHGFARSMGRRRKAVELGQSSAPAPTRRRRHRKPRRGQRHRPRAPAGSARSGVKSGVVARRARRQGREQLVCLRLAERRHEQGSPRLREHGAALALDVVAHARRVDLEARAQASASAMSAPWVSRNSDGTRRARPPSPRPRSCDGAIAASSAAA